MSIQKQLLTVEEFDKFAEADSDRLLELIDGEVYEKMPTEEHGVLQARIASRMIVFAEQRSIPACIGSGARHRPAADRKNSRIPDISVRLTTDPIVTKGSVLKMPDLAVEIFSPDDEYQDLRAKAEYCLKNGSKLVWLFFPAKKTIEVCTLDADGNMQVQTLGIDDTLDGSAVLPGFTLALRDIFNL